MFLVISAVLSLVTLRTYAHGHSPVANPGDHSVAALRGSLEKGPLRPSAPNPGTHIPATVSHPLLGSLNKGPVPPSEPNPRTNNIPAATTGQSNVAPPPGRKLKKASVRPPPAPNGDP